MAQLEGEPSGFKSSDMNAIQVRLWEVYLIRSRANLFNVLSSYALDNGPFDDDDRASGLVSFRFTTFDWKRSIAPMLFACHIPFDIVSTFPLFVMRSHRKAKVYVVEGDLPTLFSMNTALEKAGYDVLLAHRVEPLLEPMLPATDVFVIDQRMSGTDGLSLCRHLKAQSATRDARVIILTSAEIEADARLAGADDVLQRPFEITELLELLDSYRSGVTLTE